MLDDLVVARAKGAFLADASDEDLGLLAGMIESERIRKGETLVKSGSRCDEAFLVLEGRLRIGENSSSVGRALRKEYGAGDLVGAVPLATGTPLDGNIECTDDCRFARLNRAVFDPLMEACPELWKKVHSLALSRMRRAFLARNIEGFFGPFGNLLPHALQEIESEAQWITLKSGETLFDDGDVASHLHILITGRLLVASRDTQGQEKVFRTISEGGIAGEVGLLMNLPHSNTVFAGRDSELVRIPRNSFITLLERSSESTRKVTHLLADRLKGDRRRGDSDAMAPRCLGVIPASQFSAVDAVVGGIQASLEEVGTVKVLTSESVDRELGMPGISHAKETDPAYLRLVQWLIQLENKHRYLIYRADPTWTEWSERCIRQVDSVIVVADAATAPGLGSVEQRISDPRRPWGLVLLHSADTVRPSNTAAWLDGSHVEDVLHVRRENKDDFDRLARILTGRAVGLVLGGGGAKGFAHLGVRMAMAELGIPIDMVGGTSIGATLAAQIAQGQPVSDCVADAVQSFHKLIDYSLPLVSLISGGRISRLIDKEAGDADIEDLWIPYFSIATNLTKAQQRVHKRGRLAHAVRASISLPGILPPVYENGDVLVDGGVLNNLPIDVMRERNPFGTIIAVDVAGTQNPTAKEEWPTTVSGWRLGLDRLLPWRRAPRIPSIASTILQSTTVGSNFTRNEILRSNLADLYLDIRVKDVGLLDFAKVEQVAKIGYEESIGPLRTWTEREGS